MKRMDSNVEQKVIELLMAFLEKATGNNATTDEIAIIPEIAKILLDIR